MIADLAKLPLEFLPGDAFNYSVSTDVLGYIVGKLSGMPFETFLHERSFKPLGMVDTDFHVPPEKHDRLAANYQPRQRRHEAVRRPRDQLLSQAARLHPRRRVCVHGPRISPSRRC